MASQVSWNKSLSTKLGLFVAATSTLVLLMALGSNLALSYVQVAKIEHGRGLGLIVSGEGLNRVRAVQLASTMVFLATIGASFLVARGVIHRTQRLAEAAERIAAGELTLKAGLDGGDEISALGASFDKMIETLRSTIDSERKRRSRSEKVIVGIRETVTGLSSASSEILASTDTAIHRRPGAGCGRLANGDHRRSGQADRQPGGRARQERWRRRSADPGGWPSRSQGDR